MTCLFGFALAAFVTVVVGTIPSGYILDVAPSCNAVSTGSAKITVTSDLAVTVSILCAQGTTVPVSVESNKVQYKATVFYSSSGSCSFKYDSSNGLKSYAVTLVVAWGIPNSEVLSSEERWQVTCTFDNNGAATATAKTVGAALLAPAEIQRNIGSATSDTITLKVCDVLGNEITLANIPMGRMVQLKGETNVASGLRVTSCDAVGTQDSTTVHVLKGGCGDGRIFPSNEGFTSNAKVVNSPFFPFFKVAGNTGVQFVCNFTTCTSGLCDGTSCQVVAGRRKRSDNSIFSDGIPQQAASPAYSLTTIPKRKVAILEKPESEGIWKTLMNVPMITGIFATIAIVALFLAMYACVRNDLKFWSISTRL